MTWILNRVSYHSCKPLQGGRISSYWESLQRACSVVTPSPFPTVKSVSRNKHAVVPGFYFEVLKCLDCVSQSSPGPVALLSSSFFLSLPLPAPPLFFLMWVSDVAQLMAYSCLFACDQLIRDKLLFDGWSTEDKHPLCLTFQTRKAMCGLLFLFSKTPHLWLVTVN